MEGPEILESLERLDCDAPVARCQRGRGADWSSEASDEVVIALQVV